MGSACFDIKHDHYSLGMHWRLSIFDGPLHGASISKPHPLLAKSITKSLSSTRSILKHCLFGVGSILVHNARIMRDCMSLVSWQGLFLALMKLHLAIVFVDERELGCCIRFLPLLHGMLVHQLEMTHACLGCIGCMNP